MPLAKIKEFNNTSEMGIYCISDSDAGDYAPDDKINFKIGRTVDIRKRLNAYHICFNDGFYIYPTLLLNDKYNTLKLKLKGDARKAMRNKAIVKTKEIEKYIHDQLKDVNKTTSTRRISEWFEDRSDLNEINKVFKAAHIKFKNDTLPPIYEYKDNYYNIFEIDGEKIKVSETYKHDYSGVKSKYGRIRELSKKLKDYKFIE